LLNSLARNAGVRRSARSREAFFENYKKYNQKMKFLGVQTLIALWLAFAPVAHAVQGLDGRATASPAVDGEAPATPKAGTAVASVREQLSRLTQPSDNATQALQIGFLKLKRVCDYGLNEKPAPIATEVEATKLVGDRQREDLANVQRALEKIETEYRQSSRITKNASCKYAPALQLFSAACRGFYEDNDRLTLADQAAQRLVAQTQERLKLYGQYEALERQGCVRAGFTQKLWTNEEKYLWPILLRAPDVFKSLLPSDTEN
jgi:hypothetical protein